MLAFVFWHRPAAGVDRYEARLAEFHAVLAADPPPGYGGSRAFEAVEAPWLAGKGHAYEDWYLVDDWAALGTLNEHAVSGARAAPHDAAAARAAFGTGGIYALVAGPAAPPAHPHAAWVAKPTGMAYPEFHAALAAALPPGASAWRRQLTLGPAAEYTVRSPEPVALPWPATALVLRDVLG
jgi:hypothetical protein